MGIYVFNRESLIAALDNTHVDFGKHVIPSLLGKMRVMAYIFEGYWEDIGTIRSFFEANLMLTDTVLRSIFSIRSRRSTPMRASSLRRRSTAPRSSRQFSPTAASSPMLMSNAP
jgi:ADP-glucose pyrophosphorylase